MKITQFLNFKTNVNQKNRQSISPAKITLIFGFYLFWISELLDKVIGPLNYDLNQIIRNKVRK